MSLDVTVRRGTSGTIVELSGEINSSTSEGLLDQLLPLVGEGNPLVVDLYAVGYVSSAGLRTLLVVYREAQHGGTSVRLSGLSDELRFVMSVTGFLDFFESDGPSDSARVLR